jgi:DnaJ like chaperone protein
MSRVADGAAVAAAEPASRRDNVLVMLLILLFALIGFKIDGITGLLIGALIGFGLSRMARASRQSGLLTAQSQFLDSTFAVMGALCKADGVVTRDEIRVTEQLFARLQLSPEQKNAAKAAFTRGKAPDFDLEGEVDRFVQSARGGAGMFQLFLQVQLSAVAADGQVHPAEHAMLVRIARRLGLSEMDLAGLEALLRAAAGGAPAAAGPPPQQRLIDAYAALGVTAEASEAEIKRAYRKLMSENHPDKLAAKGLPDSMRQLAEERARELNVAYDLIRKARQFS